MNIGIKLFFSPFIDSRKKGREGEKRETSMPEGSIDWLPLAGTPIGDQTCSPGMYSDQESNPQPFGS